VPRNRRDLDEERRRLFRRMEWVFVYAPPLLAAFIGVFGAAFLAWAVYLPGTTFWGRWAIGVLLILVLPGLVYYLLDRKNRS
jgi:hypothetical protein